MQPFNVLCTVSRCLTMGWRATLYHSCYTVVSFIFTPCRLAIAQLMVLDSAWMNRMLFDPARVMSQTRNYVIRHYYESEASRRLVVLIANILKSIAANPNTDPGYVHKASALLQLIHRSLSRIASRPLNPSREVDAREATKGLYHTIEVGSICFL
jgi:hypothetical protein